MAAARVNYTTGQVMEGRVVDITKFGAFVKLPGGKTGLVHISQISAEYVKEVSDYLSVGATVFVKISAIDEKGRIQLSIKDVKEEERAQALKLEEKPHRHLREDLPPRDSFRRHRERHDGDDSFEKKLRSFMRQSEDRQVDIKRNIDAKRGIKKKKKRKR
ncbi:MAG: S1 RNA-binding domain-containing protein [bacterium]